jgi:hypothetical protein
MTFVEFDNFQKELLNEVVRMKDTKGKEYANGSDRFANFRRLEQQLKIQDVKICWVYLAKHLDAISHYVEVGRVESTEPIMGRIVDAITYLTLLGGMIFENEHPKQQPFQYDGPQLGIPCQGD